MSLKIYNIIEQIKSQNLYTVTTDGNVWATNKQQRTLVKKDKRILKVVVAKKTGYGKYTICVNKKRLDVLAHRFIWIWFNGPIPKELQINHIDGDKLNNRLSNLELLSPRENTKHSIKIGLRNTAGENNALSKLNKKDIEVIRSLRKQGLNLKQISILYSIDVSHVSSICRRRSWKHVL